jgi:hypothetical protein
MGFEVVFHYHEEITKGEYNREELKSKRVKVGSPYDEVGLDIVAGKIISQLAKRSILVVDVEIYEFVKKKISYEETEDGIKLKNKKFRFDDGAVISDSGSQEDDLMEQLAEIIQEKAPGTDVQAFLSGMKKGGNRPSQPQVTRSVSRHEIFDPPADLIQHAKNVGLAFTVGKKYPIFQDKIKEDKIFYATMNDRGREQDVWSEYFVPINAGLLGGFAAGSATAQDKRLWQDSYNGDGSGMPSLR